MKPEDIKRANKNLESIQNNVEATKKDLLDIALELCRADNWEAANKVLDGCGIEYAGVKDRELKYINRGDTYDETICQEGSEAPFIGSWGDWYEAAETEYEEEEGVIHCGYCGEFTPITEEQRADWHSVKCESCGHYVDGHDD